MPTIARRLFHLSVLAAIALVASGCQLYSWGWNADSQLGDGTTTDRNTPTQITSDNWLAVSAGAEHSCAIRTDRTAWCWGANFFGQLGDGTTTLRSSPTRVGTASNWATISAGGFFTCGTRTDGTAWCWGDNSFSRLGIGTSDSGIRTTPTEVAGGATNWATISAGGGHACATRTDGTLWCWGTNNFGVLGTGGDPIETSRPTQVAGGATNWKRVSAGTLNTCGLRTDGTAWCWGGNLYGQVGDGTTTGRSVPTRVGTATTWKTISAGVFHSCATRTDGTAWCWGRNLGGSLGIGTRVFRAFVPTQVAGDATNWATISAGLAHTCATRTDRTAWCWGSNDLGQLGIGTTGGDGTTPDDPEYVPGFGSTTPVQAGTDSGWVAVDAGGYHTVGLALNSDS